MDKITVRNANVVLDIDPEEKSLYMSKGYSVIDAAGNVIEAAIPDDVPALKVMIAKLQEELKAKDAEIQKLKSAKTKKADKA